MANYPLPAWLNQSTDTAEDFSRGLALGAQIQESQNRLDLQSQNMAMDAALKAKEIEQQALHDRQQVEVNAAYQKQRLEMDRMRLEQIAEVNKAKTKDAAMKFAAQEEYRRRVVGGEDAATVGLQLGPSMGMSPGGLASLYRASRPPEAIGNPTVENYAGQEFLRIPKPKGAYTMQQIKQPLTIPEGPLQARPVIGPDNKPVPGMIAVPGTSGQLIARNIPGNEFSQVRQQIELLEKGKWGRYLLRGSGREDWNAQQKQEFKSVQTKYDKLQENLERIADREVESKGTETNDGGAVRMSEELVKAREAITVHKVPRATVAKKFKERTGMDLPDNIK